MGQEIFVANAFGIGRPSARLGAAALCFSWARFASTRVNRRGEPMVNTASFPSGGALVVRGAREARFAREARAKNTVSVGCSYTYFCFSPSVQNLNGGLTVRTFPREYFSPKKHLIHRPNLRKALIHKKLRRTFCWYEFSMPRRAPHHRESLGVAWGAWFMILRQDWLDGSANMVHELSGPGGSDDATVCEKLSARWSGNGTATMRSVRRSTNKRRRTIADPPRTNPG